MFSTLKRAIASLARPQLPHFDDTHAILWEPCSRSHGEVVPGYASLLLDLGYCVTVFMTPARLDEGLFSRFDHPDLSLPRMSQRRIARLMRGTEVKGARVVLVSTVGKLPHRADMTPNLERVFGPATPRRVLVVDHDAQARIDAGAWDERTLTLRALRYKGAGSVVVNPHVFGKVSTAARAKTKTVFLLIGAARSKRRDQGMVEQAALRLLDNGIDNFEIRQIGKPGSTPSDPRLARHIIGLGRLDFTDLYDEVEAGHFILSPLSAEKPDHQPYRSTKTTGSFQLAYGFRKPCIVDKAFADGTALTIDNSLLYDGADGLAGAMAAASRQPQDVYAAMCAAMARDADALYARSLDNLRAALND